MREPFLLFPLCYVCWPPVREMGTLWLAPLSRGPEECECVCVYSTHRNRRMYGNILWHARMQRGRNGWSESARIIIPQPQWYASVKKSN